MAFTGIARILVQMNSCINPIIYASTIPAYKKLIRGLFSCNRIRRTNAILMKVMTDENEILKHRKTNMGQEYLFVPPN